jgi:hypothetical protein
MDPESHQKKISLRKIDKLLEDEQPQLVKDLCETIKYFCCQVNRSGDLLRELSDYADRCGEMTHDQVKVSIPLRCLREARRIFHSGNPKKLKLDMMRSKR